MQADCSAAQLHFARFGTRQVVAAFDGGEVTSNAGAILAGSRSRPWADSYGSCFTDSRAPSRWCTGLRRWWRSACFAIALGYEDLNDHDDLRHDPAMAVLAGKLAARRKDCAPVAGKSTLNRLELSRAEPTRYHKIAHDQAAIEALAVEVFLEAHERVPQQIILDLDATDDPLHGDQEGRFFHGYYDCHCYMPLYVFGGRHLLGAKLRRSNIDGAAGAVEEVGADHRADPAPLAIRAHRSARR